MKPSIGTTYTFLQEAYVLTENHILPEEDKMPLLYRLNGYALVFILVASGITILLFWGNLSVSFTLVGTLLYLFSFLVFLVVHELLHGIAFVLGSNHPWSTMKFGIILRNGLAYCISTVPITIRRAKWSLVMPLLVVCIPLYVFAVLQGYFALAILAVLFASGSVGDIYYLWELRSFDNHQYMMETLPTKHGYNIGFLIYDKV